MKKVITIFTILCLIGFSFDLPFAQTKKQQAGYKYHSEEFIFFNWNEAKPVIYIFQTTTSFDGPRIIRFYRGWYSLDGQWSMFVDERIDNKQPSDTPLEDALKVTRQPNGHRQISFKYNQADLELQVQDIVTDFEVETKTKVLEHTRSLHQGVLINQGVHMGGYVIHNYRHLRNDNPIIENTGRKYGKYDIAYLFNEAGDVMIAGYSDIFDNKNRSYFWVDEKNNQSVSTLIDWTKTVKDTTAHVVYPVGWDIEMMGRGMDAHVLNIGSFILAGDPSVPQTPDLYGLFVVRGSLVLSDGKEISVCGLINHIQD
ncbi:MAG: hypothetical protein B6244_13195 [Candidatus Cloacimonetes bacterium 4572_55]|nr:MAG: hypothetical protein B6244_13195 [Candidatus Cloacimonetes bacterium 4572_55]